jgi:hypothetical protein
MKQINKNTSLRVRVLGFFRRRQRRLAAECELRAWWRDSGLWCVALGVPLSAAELARVLRLYRRCGREVRRAFGTDWRVRKLLLRSASVAAVRRSRVRRVQAWRQRRWFRRLWRRLWPCQQTGTWESTALPDPPHYARAGSVVACHRTHTAVPGTLLFLLCIRLVQECARAPALDRPFRTPLEIPRR